MEKQKLVFGIDLGTTTSLCGNVSATEGGQVFMINSTGSTVNASYVHYSDRGIDVGNQTKERMQAGTVCESKRLLGKKFEDESIQEEIKEGFFPFEIVKGEHGEAMIRLEIVSGKGKNKKVEEKLIRPYEVSAEVLRYLKNAICVEYKLDETQPIDCVITVPANFNFKQRQETVKAAQKAGINVLRLLNEPTAAAIAYSYNSEEKELDNKTIFIFDFGGGTLDCTIMKIEVHEGRQQYKVLSTFGNTHLGGVDIDNALARFAKRTLAKEYPDEFEELFGDDVNAGKKNNYMNKLKYACEQAKINMSTIGSASIAVSSLNTDIEIDDIEIDKTFWENTLQGISVTCMKTVEGSLERAKLTKDDIDKVIMIGGSSRIKEVAKEVDKFFDGNKMVKNKKVEKQEAVTIGASILAHLLNIKTDSYEIDEVCPLSLGIEVAGHKIQNLIEASTKVPFSGSYEFVNNENQKGCIFRIYEGNDEVAKEDNFISSFKIGNIPPMPFNSIHFNFSLEYDECGMVTACATIDRPTNLALDGSARCSFALGSNNMANDAQEISCNVVQK